jgi:hypothetical protein
MSLGTSGAERVSDETDVRFGKKQTYAPQNGMAALPLKQRRKRNSVNGHVRFTSKADMCDATRNVYFGPIADIVAYSITSSARASTADGTLRPRDLVVLRLITISYLVGACTGISAGFSPLSTRST